MAGNDKVQHAVIRQPLRSHHEPAAHAPPIHYRDHQRGEGDAFVVVLDAHLRGLEVQENGLESRRDIGCKAVEALHFERYKTDHSIETNAHTIAEVASFGVKPAGDAANVDGVAFISHQGR